MCELIPQVESTHLNGSYGIYDNGPSFGQQQNQMNGSAMSAHYESFMPMPPGHPHQHHHHPHHHQQHNGTQQHQQQQQQQHRYSYHHHQQQAPMAQEKGCWETESAIIPAGINEEFISLKSNDFSISVYHRYNGVAPVSSLDSLGNDQVLNEPYNSHSYNNNNSGSNFQVSCPGQTAVYSAAFHGAAVPPAAASRGSSGQAAGQLGASSRSLYMPPTPPSSEPGSPSQQQQQQQQIMQQSRAAGVVHHQLQPKQEQSSNGGLIHTNQQQQQQQQYVSSGERTVESSSSSRSRKPSPPPFSNGKQGQQQQQQQQAVSHFSQAESRAAQVPPIVSGNALHLSRSDGTIPVPFGGGQCSARSKVSHSAPNSSSFGRSGQQQAQYNAAIVAQITAASHGVQPRYNRRNNPELEKRRIHRCDYPG